jgi:hypothetical protein
MALLIQASARTMDIVKAFAGICMLKSTVL